MPPEIDDMDDPAYGGAYAFQPIHERRRKQSKLVRAIVFWMMIFIVTPLFLIVLGVMFLALSAGG